MAQAQAKKNVNNKRSGFDAPAYGNMLPEGAKIKHLKGGGFEVVYPKGSGSGAKSGAGNKKK